MPVHGRLGPAGAARGPQPERDIGARRRRSVQSRRASVEPVAPLTAAGHVIADDDDAILETGFRSVECRSHLGEQRRVHDDRDRTALLQEVRVVAASKGRVGRHGDGANLHGAQEGGNEFRRIEEDEQDTVPRADAKRGQRVPDPVHALGQLPVGDVSSFGQDGQTIAAPFPDVSIDQVVGEVIHRRISCKPAGSTQRCSEDKRWTGLRQRPFRQTIGHGD